jgi:hypothetical protein
MQRAVLGKGAKWGRAECEDRQPVTGTRRIHGVGKGSESSGLARIEKGSKQPAVSGSRQSENGKDGGDEEDYFWRLTDIRVILDWAMRS